MAAGAPDRLQGGGAAHRGVRQRLAAHARRYDEGPRLVRSSAAAVPVVTWRSVPMFTRLPGKVMGACLPTPTDTPPTNPSPRRSSTPWRPGQPPDRAETLSPGRACPCRPDSQTPSRTVGRRLRRTRPGLRLLRPGHVRRVPSIRRQAAAPALLRSAGDRLVGHWAPSSQVGQQCESVVASVLPQLELGGSPRHRRGGEHAACCGGDGEERGHEQRAAVQEGGGGTRPRARLPCCRPPPCRGRDLGLMRLLGTFATPVTRTCGRAATRAGDPLLARSRCAGRHPHQPGCRPAKPE
jgi:hypothetical protein